MEKRAQKWILSVFIVATALGCLHAEGDELSEAVAWLKKASQRNIRAAKRTMTDGTAAFPPQVGVCEWIYGETRRLPGYLASASLPLAGIRAMIERRKGR